MRKSPDAAEQSFEVETVDQSQFPPEEISYYKMAMIRCWGLEITKDGNGERVFCVATDKDQINRIREENPDYFNCASNEIGEDTLASVELKMIRFVPKEINDLVYAATRMSNGKDCRSIAENESPDRVADCIREEDVAGVMKVVLNRLMNHLFQGIVVRYLEDPKEAEKLIERHKESDFVQRTSCDHQNRLMTMLDLAMPALDILARENQLEEVAAEIAAKKAAEKAGTKLGINDVVKDIAKAFEAADSKARIGFLTADEETPCQKERRNFEQCTKDMDTVWRFLVSQNDLPPQFKEESYISDLKLTSDGDITDVTLHIRGKLRGSQLGADLIDKVNTAIADTVGSSGMLGNNAPESMFRLSNEELEELLAWYTEKALKTKHMRGNEEHLFQRAMVKLITLKLDRHYAPKDHAKLAAGILELRPEVLDIRVTGEDGDRWGPSVNVIIGRQVYEGEKDNLKKNIDRLVGLEVPVNIYCPDTSGDYRQVQGESIMPK
ncbi:MAG: hypothetical protein ABII07_04205 [Patescibacteria group bacterium]